MVEAAKADGFRRGRNLDKLGQKGQDTAELFFEDVWVPSDSLLGAEEGQGMYQLMQQLPKERLIIAVGAVASMFRAIEMTIAYTKERKVFGKPLFDMQNTRFKLAVCQSLAVIADNFVNNCVTQLLFGGIIPWKLAYSMGWSSTWMAIRFSWGS
jgi:acyl-CoA dehydrogenase